MLAHDDPGLVDDLASGLAQMLGQEGPSVAVGDKADVMAVRLVRHREPPATPPPRGPEAWACHPTGTWRGLSWSEVSTAST